MSDEIHSKINALQDGHEKMTSSINQLNTNLAVMCEQVSHVAKSVQTIADQSEKRIDKQDEKIEKQGDRISKLEQYKAKTWALWALLGSGITLTISAIAWAVGFLFS